MREFKMEHIAGILTALQNNWFALAVLILIMFLLTYGVKKGVISFNGKGLKVGIQDKERTIIRYQMQYVNAVLDGTVKDIPVRLNEGLHHYRTKYIIGKVKDLFEEMIVYNHITNSEDYISIKQELAYNLVIKLTDDDFFRKPDFKDYMYKLVKDIILKLVTIRENETNGK